MLKARDLECLGWKEEVQLSFAESSSRRLDIE